MMDWRTGLPDMEIKFTYVKENNLVNLYYYSGNLRISLLLYKVNREKLLEYLNKYEDWHKIAVEKKITLKKKMGHINSGIYFKYAGSWYEGTPLLDSIYFFSLNREMHQFLIRPIRTICKQNRSITFKPEILYFNYKDAMTLKKALSMDFIETQVNKRKDELKALQDLENEFK